MTENEKKRFYAKHRLEEAEARDRVKERKARTRRLIQEGAILEKANAGGYVLISSGCAGGLSVCGRTNQN